MEKQRFTPEIVAQLRAALEAAPEKPPSRTATQSEVVTALLPQIRRLKDGGYAYAEIAELLRNAGLNVTGTTLGAYVRRALRPPKKTVPSRKTRRKPHDG